MEIGSNLRETTASLWKRVTRRKQLHTHDGSTQFRRCLSTTRLTLMGLGSTVGVGIYVLIGVATKEYAGPAVLISFMVAGVATLLNALCFAEFAGKTSITGASYTFAYQSIGEAVAFLIGWSQVIMYYTSNATTARAWSGYLDSLFDMAVKNYTIDNVGEWNMGPPFGEFPDFLALVVILFVVIVTSVGVHFSSVFNAVFAGISISILLFATVVGFVFADINNWKNPDHGGFVPFGMPGIFAGASACFYAYQGYDLIAMSAEEAKSPEKSIPKAIVIELLIVMVLYFAAASSFTLMIPYWEVDTRAPYPAAFALKGITWAKYIVGIGPVLALTNLCVLGMYGIARQTYIMSKDGLLFQFFSTVNKRTKTPILATLFNGLIFAILALFLDLKNMVGFMVILGFVNFGILCIYVIIIRYKVPDEKTNACKNNFTTQNTFLENISDTQTLSEDELHMTEESQQQITGDSREQEDMSDVSLSRQSSNERGDAVELNSQLVLKKDSNQAETSETLGLGVKFLLMIIVFSALLLSLLILYSPEDMMRGRTDAVISILVLVTLIVVPTFLISRHPEGNPNDNGFKVPLMPYLPVFAVLCNIFLLVAVTDATGAILCIIMMLLGALVYGILILKDTVGSIRAGLSREEAILLNNEDRTDDEL